MSLRAGTLCSGAHLHFHEACSQKKARCTKPDPLQVQRRCCKTPIVSVNQLSIYRPIITWYIGERNMDNIVPDVNLNITQNLVTNLTRHEPPDVFDLPFRERLHSVRKQNPQDELNSFGQVSREAGFSILVEVEQYFVNRPAIRLKELGITTACRTLAQRSILVSFKARPTQRIVVWQTITNAILLCDSMPAVC